MLLVITLQRDLNGILSRGKLCLESLKSMYRSTMSSATRWSASENSYFLDQPVGVYRSLSIITA